MIETYIANLTGGKKYIIEAAPYVKKESAQLTFDEEFTNEYGDGTPTVVTLFGDPKGTSPVLVNIQAPPVITYSVSEGTIGKTGLPPVIFTNSEAKITVNTDVDCDITISRNLGKTELAAGG